MNDKGGNQDKPHESITINKQIGHKEYRNVLIKPINTNLIKFLPNSELCSMFNVQCSMFNVHVHVQ
jgi:hypothetical protein